MDYDQVLEHVGQFGLWQVLVCSLAALAAMSEAFMTLQYTFIGYADFDYFRCAIDICNDTSFSDFVNFAIPINGSSEDKACRMYKPLDPNGGCTAENFSNETMVCTRHIFSEDVPYGLSLTQQLDRVPCSDDESWALNPVVSPMAFINMGYMFGLLIGSLVFGLVSDRFGRRKALLSAAVLSGGISMTMSFIKNYWAYFFLRLLLGIFSKALFMLAFMVCVEISGVDYKTWLGILIQVPFALGEMLVGLVAFYAQEWQTLQQILSGVVLGLCLLWYLMPESPRWLLSKNRYQEAIQVLTNGSRLNRRPLPEGFLRYDDENSAQQGKLSTEPLGISSLFKTMQMAKITLIIFVNWITATLSYYGLTMLSVNLSEDIYINFVLSAVIEIPSYIFCVLVMDRLGRKPIMILCQILAGSTCIIAAFIDEDQTAAINALTLIGKFGASASFAIAYLFTAELYPTSIRNSGLGAASMMGRIGGIAAPLLAASSGQAPLISMGTSSLIAGLLSIFLPETLGKKLPENISQVQDLYSNAKEEVAQQEAPKMTPELINVPAKKPTAFVIPSIVIDPGTPKMTTPLKKPLPVIMIPDDDQEVQNTIEEENKKDDFSEESLTAEESQEAKSRRFSKLPPAPVNDPSAVKMGHFAVSRMASVSEENSSSSGSGVVLEVASLDPEGSSAAHERSRRFSKLPPASTDSPNAVKVSSKFTMIPRDE